MSELRIITIPFDPRTGVFDDEGLREYLADREVLRYEPGFCVQEGRPMWSVFLETRPLQGASSSVAKQEGTPGGNGNSEKQRTEKAAFLRLLKELDEVERARYDRLLDWRREEARREGVPPYVLLTNRQALDVARRSPRTLEGLGKVKGIGRKRIDRHGKAILEVIHGRAPEGGAGRSAAVRGVDGDHEVADGADGPVPEAAAPQPDGADREPGPGDPGGRDQRGVLQQQDGEAEVGGRPAEPAAGDGEAGP